MRSLTGEWQGYFQLRVGDYRVIFTIAKDEPTVVSVRGKFPEVGRAAMFYFSGAFSSGFVPMNSFLPSGNVRSRPFARLAPSLA